jgi:hypothetical protein
MARKLGQIIAPGERTSLVRVYLGRGSQTGTRKYHNHTVHGPFREARRFLNLRLQQRDNGRVSRAAGMSLNQSLDQWLTTVVKAWPPWQMGLLETASYTSGRSSPIHSTGE